MTKTPFLSVVTITYNNLLGLAKTHESVRAQTDTDFEWIVIDGGSADATADYLQGTDALWISQPDKGIYDAMNKGLERAHGTYVIFMNAGDAFAAPSVIERLKQNAQESQPDFLYGDSYETVPEGGEFYKKAKPHQALATGMITHHQAMLYCREKIKDLRYDTNYKIAGDYDFTARFLKDNARALYCPFPIALYESGGVSQMNAALGRREEFEIRQNVFGKKQGHPYIVFIRQWLASSLRQASPALYRLLKSRVWLYRPDSY